MLRTTMLTLVSLASGQELSRPNIVVFMADDFGESFINVIKSLMNTN